MMRDAEQREMAALEKADLERRRLMTDEQRISEDKRLGENKMFNAILHCRDHNKQAAHRLFLSEI